MDQEQIQEPVIGGTELVAGMRVSSSGVKIKIEMAAIGTPANPHHS
jgi:hypothetical protein